VAVELLDHWIVNAVATFRVSPFLGAETDIVTLPVLAPVPDPTTVVLSLQLWIRNKNKRRKKDPNTSFEYLRLDIAMTHKKFINLLKRNLLACCLIVKQIVLFNGII
jgi:hypothetical protein